MMTLVKIIRYQLRDLLRGKWILLYTLFFLLVTEGLFQFTGDGARVALSLMNIILIIIPLASIIFGSLFLYGAREFIELLLAQPISRRSLFAGLYISLTLPLVTGYLLGVGLPFLFHHTALATQTGLAGTMLIAGSGLTAIFTALACVIALRKEIRVVGVGMALLLWLFFAVIYDGIVLLLIFAFEQYPLERLTIIVSLLNPIDLARILILLKLDIAALMGYTGAVFEAFFGSGMGIVISLAALLVWLVVPIAAGVGVFANKDF